MKKNVLFIFLLFFCMEMSLYAQQTQPGLYVGDVFQSEMDLYDALDWITLNAQDDGEYSVVLGESIALSSNVLDCKGKSVTIHLKTVGSDIQLTYATRSPSSSLFTIKKGVTFVLEDGVELIGRPSASRPPVTVDGGQFIMNGGAVKDSKVDHSADWRGGGVDVLSGGTFIMNGGVISGNSCHYGAGVNVAENATFTMKGGTICKNYAYYKEYNNYITGRGGGVYVNGTFTLIDGIIDNNFTYRDFDYYGGQGGGIYISNNGSFVMQGGVISNNSGCGIYIDGHNSLYGSYGGKAVMDGGTITSNSGRYGGVYINGSFTMNNGTITKNSAASGGGVYIRSGFSFVMNGGEITENTANGDRNSWGGYFGGGGVCIEGTFTMNGGLISNNIATGYVNKGGGGVFVQQFGTFIMNDGTISKNRTTKSGGGVCVHNATFVKSGTAGIIYGGDATEDKANKADQYGHAVYTDNGSRDTTARATKALDSRQQGADGGWE